MSRSIFGWDLPPGVSPSDIPGNRPEDEAWEKITLDFWNGKYCSDELWKKFEEAKLSNDLIDIVDKAIDYGMELGRKEQLAIQAESDFCDARYLREELNKVLDKIEKGEVETP